jgi:hypothetical protein
VDALDINAIIERVDINAIVARVDVNAVIDRVDIEQVIDRVDVNAVIDRVDIDQVIDRVDINAVMERVDVNAILDNLDIDSLIRHTEIGSIIAHSTTSVLSDAMDLVRAQGVGLDDFVARWVNRILRRPPGSLPLGPPLLVAPSTPNASSGDHPPAPVPPTTDDTVPVAATADPAEGANGARPTTREGVDR